MEREQEREREGERERESRIERESRQRGGDRERVRERERESERGRWRVIERGGDSYDFERECKLKAISWFMLFYRRGSCRYLSVSFLFNYLLVSDLG